MMVTCPDCWGRVDCSQIQLEEIQTDCKNFFYCKKCKGIFEFNEVIRENLEVEWSEDFLKDLYKKIEEIDASKQEGVKK